MPYYVVCKVPIECLYVISDVRGGLGHTTFETVRGSLTRRAADEGRRAPKAPWRRCAPWRRRALCKHGSTCSLAWPCRVGPAAAGGDGRGGHTPAPLVRRRAREVGRQRCRRPRVVPIHCTVERAPLGHGRRAPPMVTALAGAVFDRVGRWQFSRFVIQVESLRI